MKYFLNAILIIMFSGTVTFGQVSPKMDPLSIQFDQMKGSITNIIDMVNRQSESIKNLEGGGEAILSIDALKADVSEAKIKLNEFYENFTSLTDDVSRLEGEAEKLTEKHLLLEGRISSLEQIISEIPTPLPGKVILTEDGKAKVFSLDDLTGLKSQLPSAEKCAEFGPVLEETLIRDVNSFFVINSQNKISMCKFVLNIWQEKYSSRNEFGHVVVLNN